MFKKIIVATLLAVMITGLVYGAWYRTQARAANESAATSEQQHGQTSDLAQSEAGLQQGGGYRNSQETAVGGLLSAVVSLTGTIQSVSGEGVIVAVDGQAPVEIAGRALSYASEQGFVFRQGDSLALTGFYEEQGFEIQEIENLTTGKSLALREQNGRPLWAGGRGRGG